MQSKQRPPPTRGRGRKKSTFRNQLYDWVRTIVSTFAFLAMFSHPYFIKLIHGLFNYLGVISHNSCFKIASRFSLHANTGAREVRTSNIHFLAIKDKYLEMNARTEDSLQSVIENRLLVKVLPKVRARFLSMNKSYLHPTPNELCNESQKRLLLFAYLHIQVFYVSGTNPKNVLYGRNP